MIYARNKAKQEAEDRKKQEKERIAQLDHNKKLDATSKIVEAASLSVIPMAEYGFAEAAKTATNPAVLESTASAIKIVGTAVSVGSVAISVYSGMTSENGWQTSHTVDVVANGLTLIPVGGQIWAVVWFGGNIISYGLTGQNLSQHIGSAIDHTNSTFNSIGPGITETFSNQGREY